MDSGAGSIPKNIALSPIVGSNYHIWHRPKWVIGWEWFWFGDI
jgi:hypothetical protein